MTGDGALTAATLDANEDAVRLMEAAYANVLATLLADSTVSRRRPDGVSAPTCAGATTPVSSPPERRPPRVHVTGRVPDTILDALRP